MKIPFKIKLTLIISALLILLLSATYIFTRKELEAQFIARIKTDLNSTQFMIQSLLAESSQKLTNATNAISGHVYVKEMLTDRTMDQATRDDLINSEIFFYFRNTIDLIIVSGMNGQLLAGTPTGNLIHAGLSRTPSFRKCVESGVQETFFLFHDDRYFEIVVQPFFLNDEMIGLVSVGIEITREELERIKGISGVDLAFLKRGQVFLATRWEQEERSHKSLLTAFNQAVAHTVDFEKVLSESTPVVRDLQLAGERFLYFLTPFLRTDGEGDVPSTGRRGVVVPTHVAGEEDDGNTPTTYVLIKSLDKEIRFLAELLEKIVLTGVAGVWLAIVTGYLFSLKITRPIRTLQEATREVEKGNFAHRLHIQSRDEFMELGNSFNDMIIGLAEKERVRRTMDRVVSREIATELLKGEIQLGGEEKYATILFSDIRGFTSLSEGLTPTELLAILNKYFTRMSGCIDAHQGVIDKYIGDAIMALFGVPQTRADDVVRAVAAAQDMLEALDQFNRKELGSTGKTIRIGVGINTGTLVAGNMGAENRLNYTVLGDAVNLASRLEGLCKLYNAPIIVSESTYQALERFQDRQAQPLLVRLLDNIQVKGKSSGIRVYEVFPKSAETTATEKLIARFAEGRESMLSGNFADGIRVFGEIQKDWPKDGATAQFLARCRRYQDNPESFAEEYRDQVYIATEK